MGRRQRGTGYLRKNENGTKTLVVSVTDPKSGKSRKMQATAKTEVACRQMIAVKKNAWLESLTIDSNKLSVAELCKRYLQSQYEQGVIKPSSRDRNMCTINNQIEGQLIGNLAINKVMPSDIDDHFSKLFKDKRLSASTIEKVKYVLDASFKWAVSRGELKENPVDNVRDAIDRRLDVLSAKNAAELDVVVLMEDQERAFREEALTKTARGTYKYPIGLFCVLLLETGMRCGEMTALRWSDYDAETGILMIERSRSRVRCDDAVDAGTGKLEYYYIEETTKNQKARYIQLTEEAQYVLAEIHRIGHVSYGSDEYICRSRNNRPRSVTDIEHQTATIYRNAGLDEGISGVHIFRRTFATRKRREGWSVSQVAAYLGDLESTVSKYYIADRELQSVKGKRVAVVMLPK